KEATLIAFKAGVDIDMVDECYSRHLPPLVMEGLITETEIDTSCQRVLVAKERLGLFENPYRGLDAARRDEVTLTPDMRMLAREAAVKSCVLLKNNGVLPLTRGINDLAVVGPLADSRANMQGTWAVAAHSADN